LSSDETTNPEFSLSDNVRGFIQQAYDNKIDLTIKSNRDDMIKQFKDNFPDQNIKSIRTLFSTEIPKIATAYGIEPDTVKKEPSKKFSKTLEGKTKPQEKKSEVKTVSIKNPATLRQGSPENIQQAYKYEIKSSQVSAFGNALWSLPQVFSEDLEDFTDSESSDIGDLWQPVLQARLGNHDNGQLVLAAGGTLGIVARKSKQARANRKIRKEKEAKDKGTDLENPKGITSIDTTKGTDKK